ncbi:hypothetical protein BO443_60308 [Burkholderia orbicola]
MIGAVLRSLLIVQRDICGQEIYECSGRYTRSRYCLPASGGALELQQFFQKLAIRANRFGWLVSLS